MHQFVFLDVTALSRLQKQFPSKQPVLSLRTPTPAQQPDPAPPPVSLQGAALQGTEATHPASRQRWPRAGAGEQGTAGRAAAAAFCERRIGEKLVPAGRAGGEQRQPSSLSTV